MNVLSSCTRNYTLNKLVCDEDIIPVKITIYVKML